MVREISQALMQKNKQSGGCGIPMPNLLPCYKYLKISLLLIVITIFSSSNAFSQQDIGPKKDLFVIDQILINGVKKIEKEAILEKINSRPTMMLDNYLLKRDIQKIYDLKFFDSVEAHHEVVGGKNILIFKVKERPIITKISFEGNDEISDDDLKGQVKTKEFSISDINSIKADILAIQKHYEEKGFYLASVNYELKKSTDENVDLIFNIQEFDKVRVKKIIFIGTKAFQDAELKDIMETREEGLFSFMSNSGNFKEINFNTDIERIKYFYKSKGYLQVNVGTPEITVSEDKKWVFITVKVVEGPSFSINNVTFQGEKLFTEQELREKIESKEGLTYSEDTLRKDIQKLTEMYQDEGYAFANVLRTLQIVPGENKVDVEFSFEKGKIAYFGKIKIIGNTKTRDKVVRRELKIREGVKFSGTDLRNSKENVNRLGFFEPNSVVFNTVTRTNRDDILDVEISLKERNTGQISLGAGYSTASGEFFQASIAQNNFRGLGQNLSFSVSHAKTNQTFNLSFTEPYLFDTQWTAGGDAFLTDNQQSDSFRYKKKGFDARIGYPIFEFTRLFLTYKLENINITNLNDPTVDTATENGNASSIQTTLIYDKRDNKFEPKNGHYLSLSSEYAGIGGDKKWFKNELDTRYFKNLIGDLVFRSRIYGGKIDHVNDYPIPRTERFTLGGPKNLRGYNYEDIGPRGKVVDSLGRTRYFNTGGSFAAFTTLELEHPLAREAGLKWVLFFDAGDAGQYSDFKLHKDYGFGFRWFSPIGVLRFEFGYPIDPSPENEGSKFHFDIGQLF